MFDKDPDEMTREEMIRELKKGVRPSPAVAGETVECPYCYSTIDARAKVCPHCQKRVHQGCAHHLGSLIMAVGLLALLLGILTFEALIVGVLLLVAGFVVSRA